MTQLVQLQGIKEHLEEAGYSVFAISNDPVEILADFASNHDNNDSPAKPVGDFESCC